MLESYSNKLFEFSKVLSEDEKLSWADNVQVMQVGETCLDKGAFIEEHIQRCHEVTLVISGSGLLTADNERIPCSVGDIQIISKGVSHSVIADKDSTFRYIHFAFNFYEYKPKYLYEFYEQCGNVIMHDTGNIRSILNLIVEEYFNVQMYGETVRSSLIQVLLIMLWRKANLVLARQESSENVKVIGATVYNIMKYIDEHLSEPITVKDIADKFSYSCRHVSRLFKEKTGTSIKEYIIDTRMKRAETMLEEGKLSLLEIANITGYESVQSFCKRFKMHTGKTPSELRR